MDEVENQNVEQAAQEVVLPETESTQEVEVAEPVKETKNNRDWRALRQSKDEWEKKAKFYEELVLKQSSQGAPSSSPAIQEEDIVEQLSREEYVPGDKVAKALKKQKEEFRRELDEVKKIHSNHQQNSLMSELKREYADFDQVVNPENLDLIEETNPRLAKSLAKTLTEDPYSFAVQSYEYIKSKGIGRAPPKVTEADQKIVQNKKTVPSPQTFEKRPMAQAFQPSKEMQKETYAEMMRYAQQAGLGY